jgi:hypothetical protein
MLEAKLVEGQLIVDEHAHSHTLAPNKSNAGVHSLRDCCPNELVSVLQVFCVDGTVM